MKKTTIVAILLLTTTVLSANNIMPEINNIESQWAVIYYEQNIEQKRKAYPLLIKRIHKLSKKYPEAVEPMIWEALVIATNAEFENPFKALESIDIAKKILEQSIQLDPESLDGAAFVILGTIFYSTPGWPISFGDYNRAEELLKKGIEINPNSIDSNYFYASYLLLKNNVSEAQKFFKLALKAPNRPEQLYADEQLKKEVLIALKNSEQRMLTSGRNNFLSLFSSVNNSE